MYQYLIIPILFFIVVLWLTIKNNIFSSSKFAEHRIELITIFILTILFGILNKDLLFEQSMRVVADNWRYNYPYFHYILTHILQFNELPFWNFNVNAGEPIFLFINHNYLLHIPHIISYIIYPYVNNIITTSQMFWWSLLGSIWIFSISMFFLCKSLYKSSYTALIIFMICLFSGTASGVLHQEQIMASLFYIPWILLALHRYYLNNHPAWLILSALFLGLAMINHYPHLPLYSLIIMLSLCILYYWEKILQFCSIQLKTPRRNIILLISCIFVTIIIMTPSVLMYKEYSNKISSPYRNVSDVTKGVNYDYVRKSKRTNSLNPHTIFHFLFPRSFEEFKNIGQTSLDNKIFYLGILPVLIIIIGAFSMSKKILMYWLSVASILLFFGFGAFTYGYYLLFSLDNFFQLQRLPLHLGNLVMIPLLLALAAIISQYSNKQQIIVIKSNYKVTSFFIIVVICAVVLFIYKSDYIFLLKSKNNLAALLDDILLILFFLAVCLKIFNVEITKIFKTFIFILMLTDLGSYYLRSLPGSVLPIDGDTFIALNQKDISWPNTFEFFDIRPYLTDYHAMIHQKSFIDLRLYSLLIFSDVKEFINKNRQIIINSNSARSRVHFINKSQLNNFTLNFETIHQEKLFRSKSQFPNSNLSNEVNLLSSKIISNGVLFNLDTRLKKSLSSEEEIIMVLMDAWSKNWIVEVDKNPRPLLKAGPFKAVHLEPGDKEVIFRYNPWWRNALVLYIHLLFILFFFNILWIYWNYLSKPDKSLSISNDFD
jgi:hypothetical protein